MIVKQVCERVSLALQRSLPTVWSVGGLQCVCVFVGVVVAQCLVKFTWVYLWASSSAVLWLQGKICSSVEMLQCHLLNSKGQNSLRPGRVRLPPLPSSHTSSCKPFVQVGFSKGNVLARQWNRRPCNAHTELRCNKRFSSLLCNYVYTVTSSASSGSCHFANGGGSVMKDLRNLNLLN